MRMQVSQNATTTHTVLMYGSHSSVTTHKKPIIMLLLFDKWKLKKFDVGNSFYWNKEILWQTVNCVPLVNWSTDKIFWCRCVCNKIWLFMYIFVYFYKKINTCCTLIVLVSMQVFKQSSRLFAFWLILMKRLFTSV